MAPGVRPTNLPLEFLDAELLATPLTAESSLQTRLTTLDPGLQGGTGELWREAEPRLLSRFPGLSIDELVLRRDRAWFGDSEPHRGAAAPRNLAEVYGEATQRLVKIDGGRARLRPNGGRDLSDSRRKWRWLTFALPPDFLLATAGASSQALDQLSPNLATLLADRGLAEPHLHLKAAIDFPQLWASCQRALAEGTARHDMFASPGAEFDEGRRLAPWLLRASLARLLLAWFLRDRHGAGSIPWARWLYSRTLPRLRKRHGVIAIDLHLRDALGDLGGGGLHGGGGFSALRHLFAQLSALHHQPPPKNAGDLPRCDPISPTFPGIGDTLPDFQWTQEALRYLQGSAGRADAGFARFFWQVVRLRTAFYRHVVQRPMTPGLQWFIRTYDRLWPARAPVPSDAYVENAVAMGGAGLRSLEARITSKSPMRDLKREIETIDRAARKAGSRCSAPMEMGLVFHFPRYRGERTAKGRPPAWGRGVHGDLDPKKEPTGYRYGRYYNRQRPDAASLGRLLISFPRMLERIRGVDLCTDELAIPLWVLCPLIHHVRSAGEWAADHLERHGGWPGKGRGPAIRLTIHSGEDWVHLLGGIRRIGEAVEFLSMGEGDRLGHAVALGIDAEGWSRRAGVLPMSKEERLLDLIWAWGVVTQTPDTDLRGWLPWIRARLASLSHDLFDEIHDPDLLLCFYQRLHQTPALRAVGFPSGPAPWPTPRRGVDGLMVRWLRSERNFRRAQAHLEVDVRSESELTCALQRHVRYLLASLGLTVEINPSSNLLIGHLGDLTTHPMWRLRPPVGHLVDSPDEHPPLHLSIGSDDPITFATRLPEEYQLLLDSMVEAGLSTDEAEAWLDRARQRGLTSRFTLPRSSHPLNRPSCSGPVPMLL